MVAYASYRIPIAQSDDSDLDDKTSTYKADEVPTVNDNDGYNDVESFLYNHSFPRR